MGTLTAAARRRAIAAATLTATGLATTATGLVLGTGVAVAAPGGKGPAKDPGGNNGTVKIVGLGDADETPENNPHQGCDFRVQWYGFDQGDDIVSTVSFALQSPTAGEGYSLAVTGPASVSVGGDAAGGSADLDGDEVYSLTFTGAPQENQGYHVKLTVKTPGSKGNDTKSKVFWVEGCDDEDYEEPGDGGTEEPGDGGTDIPVDVPGDGGTENPDTPDTGDDSGYEEPGDETETPVEEPGTGTESPGTPGTNPGSNPEVQPEEAEEVTTPVVLGNEADAPGTGNSGGNGTSNGTSASPAAVPTAVAAGLVSLPQPAQEQGPNQLLVMLGALLAAAGAALGLAPLARRGKRQV